MISNFDFNVTYDRWFLVFALRPCSLIQMPVSSLRAAETTAVARSGSPCANAPEGWSETINY
jgi:hypothetical protein